MPPAFLRKATPNALMGVRGFLCAFGKTERVSAKFATAWQKTGKAWQKTGKACRKVDDLFGFPDSAW